MNQNEQTELETTPKTPDTTKPATTTVEGLRVALEQLGLNSKGHKQELKQRLRKALRKQKDANNDATVDQEDKLIVEK